jgi:hypothetical protein
MDGKPGKRVIDWMSVQTWYEAGHTRDQCMEQFGFSKRSWREAVELGLVMPRTPGTQVGPDSTHFKVEQGLRAGKSYRQIAEEIGVVKSTVAFHARRLGRPVDERFNRRYDWDAVQRAHNQGMRALECCRHFGFSRATWTAAVTRGDIIPRSHLIPLDQLLVRGRRTGRGHLKTRLFAAGLKRKECEGCGLTSWHGKPIGFQLHHKNGDKLDNRLVNLQILCPNCHAQTDTWGGRNGHRRPDRHLRLVEPKDREEAA